MKDHMIQALTSTPKFKEIRAKLRAAMYHILSQKDQYQTTNFFAKNFLATEDGHLIGGIIKDYLECANLTETLSVLNTEAGGLSKVYNRFTIEKVLRKKFVDGVPILVTLLAKDSEVPSAKGTMPNLSIPSFKPKNNLLELLERPKENPDQKINLCSSNEDIYDDEEIDFRELLQVPEEDSFNSDAKPSSRKKSL